MPFRLAVFKATEDIHCSERVRAALAPRETRCTFHKEHPDGSREYTAAAGDVCYVGERSIFFVELPDVDDSRRNKVIVSAEDVDQLEEENSTQGYAYGD